MDYFLDTNTLWWYMVEESTYHSQVSKYVNDLISDNDKLVINDFVLIEMFHLIIKQRGPTNGRQYVDLLLETNFIVKLASLYDENYFRQIWNELAKYGSISSLGGRDASIIASMNEHQISAIISNDQVFKRINGIECFDPLLNTK